MAVTNGSIGNFNGSTYTGITGALSTGRNGGNWNGKGIITSQSNAKNPINLTSIAVASAGSSATDPLLGDTDAMQREMSVFETAPSNDFHAVALLVG